MKHAFHPTILREYDIRGVMEETLSEHDARAIGRAYAQMVTENSHPAPRIALARDGRLSSPALSAALSMGMQEAGATVLDCGLGPTPMLYFAVYHLQADAGIMVTGSHNPPDHNGFKMMMGNASFFGADIKRLGQVSASGVAARKGGACEPHDIKAAYIARMLEDVPNLTQSAAKKLKIAWDCGNGATGEVMAEIVRKISGRNFLINEKIDGTFPAHHPDPTVPENLEQLIALVRKNGCDLGIAFDGDGDRLGVADKSGRILWGDQLLLIYAQSVVRRNPGAVVIGDVKASRVLFDGLARLGAAPVMWKTGHSHIKSKMKQTAALLAGEMSGHMFFADSYYGFDDAIYAGLRLANLLADADYPPLDALLDALPAMVNTPEIRLECSEERKFKVIEEVKARLNTQGVAFNDVDGVRVEMPHGWWLLRASNTGGHLIARAEANTQSELDALKNELSAQLKASGVEPFFPSSKEGVVAE